MAPNIASIPVNVTAEASPACPSDAVKIDIGPERILGEIKYVMTASHALAASSVAQFPVWVLSHTDQLMGSVARHRNQSSVTATPQA